MLKLLLSVVLVLTPAAAVLAGDDGSKSEEAAKNELLEFYKAAQANVLEAKKAVDDGIKNAEEWTLAYSNYSEEFDGIVQKLSEAVLRNRQTAQDKLEVINFLQRMEGSKVFSVSQYRLNEKINRMDNYAEMIGELQQFKRELDGRYTKAVNWANQMAERHKGLGELAEAIAGKAGLLRNMKISIEVMEKYKPVPDDKFDSLRQIETMLNDVTAIVPQPISDMLGGYAKVVAGVTSALRKLDSQIQNNVRQGFMEITGPEQRAWRQQHSGEYAGIQKMTEFPEVDPQGLWIGTALDGEIYSFENERFNRLSCSAGALKGVYGHYTALLEKIRERAGTQVKIPLARMRRACEDPDFVQRLQNAAGMYEKAQDPDNYPGSFRIFTGILEEAFDSSIAAKVGRAIKNAPVPSGTRPPHGQYEGGGGHETYLLWAQALWRRYEQLAGETDFGDKFSTIQADARTAQDAFRKNYNSTRASQNRAAYEKASRALWLLEFPERWDTNPKAPYSAQNIATLLGVDPKDMLRFAALAKGSYRDQIELYKQTLENYLAIKNQLNETADRGRGGLGYNSADGRFYLAGRCFPRAPDYREDPLIKKLVLLRDFLQGKSGGSNWTETVYTNDGIEDLPRIYDDHTLDMILSAEEVKAKKAAAELKWDSPAPELKAGLAKIRAAADGVLKWQSSQRFTLNSVSPRSLISRIDRDIAWLDEQDSLTRNELNAYKDQFPARVSALAAECRGAIAPIALKATALCKDTLQELEELNKTEEQFFRVWSELNWSFKAMLQGTGWTHRVPSDIPMGNSYDDVLRMAEFARKTARQTIQARIKFAAALGKNRKAAQELALFFLPQSAEEADSSGKGSRSRLLDAYYALMAKDYKYRYSDEISGADPYTFERTALQAALLALPKLSGRPLGGVTGGDPAGGGQDGAQLPDAEIKLFYDKFARAYESADLAGVLSCVSNQWRSNTGQGMAGLDGRLRNIFSTYKSIKCGISNLTVTSPSGDPASREVSYHIVIEGELAQRRGIVNREEYDVRETVALENGKLRIIKTDGVGLLGE